MVHNFNVVGDQLFLDCWSRLLRNTSCNAIACSGAFTKSHVRYCIEFGMEFNVSRDFTITNTANMTNHVILNVIFLKLW